MDLSQVRNKKVIIAGRSFPAIYSYLKNKLPGIDLKAVKQKELDQEAEDAHVIIPIMSKIGSDLIERSSHLMLIQQWGAGLEGVAIEQATKQNIPVANVPTLGSGNAESVAEWYVMAVLNLCRKEYETRFYGEKYFVWGAPIGEALVGRTAGLIGFGGVGKELAKRLKGFQVKIIAIQRHPDQAAAKEHGLGWIGSEQDLPKLLHQSDFLFLRLPLNKHTYHQLNQETIAMLPKGACILNAARGAIIEKEALMKALQKGNLGGVAMDVFWEEPLKPNDPIKDFPNVFLTPHIAGITDHSYQGISGQVAENISRIFRGYLPLHCVNPEVKPEWLKEQ